MTDKTSKIVYRTVRLTEETYKELKHQAVDHNCSMLQLVKKLVDYIPFIKESGGSL